MKILLSLVFVICLTTACGEDPIIRKAKVKIMVDTLYQNAIKDLRPELDSICDEQFDSLLIEAKDSIMKKRIDEIKALLKDEDQPDKKKY